MHLELQQLLRTSLALLQPLNIVAGEAAPRILDADDFIRTLFLNRNTHGHLVADFCADLKDLAPFAACSVGAARVRELERRGTPKLEVEVGAAAFVDINLVYATTRETNGGNGVNLLSEIEGGETLGRGVAKTGDGESAGKLGEAAESSACVGRLALLAFESIVDCEWDLTTKRE